MSKMFGKRKEEYDFTSKGNYHPKKTSKTDRGISLTMDQWKVLREHVEEIDKAVAAGGIVKIWKKLTKEAALILIRHGESMWNEKNLFTGCVDVPLAQYMQKLDDMFVQWRSRENGEEEGSTMKIPFYPALNV
nr:phosphoglycerate mutase isoform X1 [Ipomoea batatas]